MKYVTIKYFILLIMFVLFIACSKEESDSVTGTFNYVTADVKIGSINGSSQNAYIDYNCNSINISYTIISKGKLGPKENVSDSNVRNSYLEINRVRLYFDDKSIEISKPDKIYYGDSVTQNATLTQDDFIDKLDDGTYLLSIEVVATEHSGNGATTTINETFAQDFGNVTITSATASCNTP